MICMQISLDIFGKFSDLSICFPCRFQEINFILFMSTECVFYLEFKIFFSKYFPKCIKLIINYNLPRNIAYIEILNSNVFISQTSNFQDVHFRYKTARCPISLPIRCKWSAWKVSMVVCHKDSFWN